MVSPLLRTVGPVIDCSRRVFDFTKRERNSLASTGRPPRETTRIAYSHAQIRSTLYPARIGVIIFSFLMDRTSVLFLEFTVTLYRVGATGTLAAKPPAYSRQ